MGLVSPLKIGFGYEGPYQVMFSTLQLFIARTKGNEIVKGGEKVCVGNFIHG